VRHVFEEPAHFFERIGVVQTFLVAGEMIAADLNDKRGGFAQHRPERRVRAGDEFGAQFDGDSGMWIAKSEDSAADPVAGFEQHYSQAGVCQLPS
jgi:hypothetical protein